MKCAAGKVKHKWVSIDDINRLSKKEWEQNIHQSYELVRDKLPVKIKKQIGIG
jgi:predicted DNA-binding protein (MmcQ/YjbR family)